MKCIENLEKIFNELKEDFNNEYTFMDYEADYNGYYVYMVLEDDELRINIQWSNDEARHKAYEFDYEASQELYMNDVINIDYDRFKQLINEIIFYNTVEL